LPGLRARQGGFELAPATRRAASHPDVAKEQVPHVHVVNFSAGAVTFQLRAWTDRHQDWAQVRSDLSIAINDTLARENIAIA
jgi:small-conductance mechanosensitive channel